MVLAYANVVTSTTQKNGHAVLRFNNMGGASAQGIRLNSNSTWQGANAINDTLREMYISFIGYSLAPSSNATIRRGGNVVFQCFEGQEGEFNMSETGTRLEKGGEPYANVTVSFSGSGTVLIKMKKNSTTQTALE